MVAATPHHIVVTCWYNSQVHRRGECEDVQLPSTDGIPRSCVLTRHPAIMQYAHHSPALVELLRNSLPGVVEIVVELFNNSNLWGGRLTMHSTVVMLLQSDL